jgi:hypothetical protein
MKLMKLMKQLYFSNFKYISKNIFLIYIIKNGIFKYFKVI